MFEQQEGLTKEQQEEEEKEEGYTLNASMILRAWKRYRPDIRFDEGKSEPGERRKKPRAHQKDLITLFGKKFTYELMSKIYLRMYNF